MRGVMDDLHRKHYQDRALECLLAAEDVRDPEQRLKMLEIAQQYILLSAFIGTLDFGTSHRSPDSQASKGIGNDT
jgi:hypothetical protein